MNKPIHIEGRGKKKDRRQQNHGPASELVLGDQTANLASEENQERQRTELAELRDAAVPMAQAPFVGMEREWTPEEKSGMNDALKQYGWQEQTAPGVGDELAPAVPNTEGTVADAIDEAPDLSKMTEADGQILREQFAEVNGSSPMINTILKSDQGFAPSLPLTGNAEVLDILANAHDVIAKGLPDDMVTYMHQLLFKLSGVTVTGKPGSFDAEYVGNCAYYPKNLILFVVRQPKSIPGVSADMIQRVLELHPREISGLQRGFELKSREMSNKTQRFEPNASKVAMEFGEKYGRPIGTMFETWGRRVAAVGVNENTTIDFLLVEPDPTHTIAQDAWLCSDMFPGVLETEGAARDLSTKRDPGTVLVRWYGDVNRSEAINRQAQELLKQFIVASANPYTVAEQ